MRIRTLPIAGVSVIALALSGMAAGSATATEGAAVALRASDAVASSSTTAVVAAPDMAKGKCKTKIGAPTNPLDGIIAWNDTSGSGYDIAGAVDVNCTGKAKKRSIKKVEVRGYFGAASESFNVTFYGNSSSGGTDEPDDSDVICSYTGLNGTAGYAYDGVTPPGPSVLNLGGKCKLPKGKSWVAVQNNNSAGPWYWGTTADGGPSPDWVDRNNVFGSGCTTLDNDRYLIDCLGHAHADFMLKLS